MNILIFFAVTTTIVATGECLVCYQCVEGEKPDELQNYPSCNRFLENHKCTTTVDSTCAIYTSNYLHRRTVLYDCVKQEKPFKHGYYDSAFCKSNYCNRNENWGHYNSGVSSVALPASLGLVLIATLHFL